MAMNRMAAQANSNNSSNPNQNICALRVAEHLGVHNQVRYLHTISDLVRASRMRYTVRSRMSKVKGKSVGGARKTLAQLSETEQMQGRMGKVRGYIIRVEGHAIYLNSDGSTQVDTDSRLRDCRRITHCYMVWDDLIGQQRNYTIRV